MINLEAWFDEQVLTVRDFALDLDVPLKTAQNWVYQNVEPSPENQDRIAEYITSHCAHYWVIAVPDGPISEGVCQRCGNRKEFQNSAPEIRWAASAQSSKGTSTKSTSSK